MLTGILQPDYYLYNYRAEKISGGFPDDRTGSSGVGVVML